jgi:hypothetical protein
MIGLRHLFRSILALGLIASASAQITVEISTPRRSFILGEAIPLKISITNVSGQPLALSDGSRSNWLTLNVFDSNGNPISGAASIKVGTMKIPVGQTASCSIDLNSAFPMERMGNYSTSAIVRLPGQEANQGYSSNRCSLMLDQGRIYWKQTVGVPGKAGQNNEYRVIIYDRDGASYLYTQLYDLRTGGCRNTYNLGSFLSFQPPSVSLDTALNLHVLYLMSPDVWGHFAMTAAGKMQGRDLYRSGDAGKPILYTTRDGKVAVANAARYDPKAEAAARAKARKASDRPAILAN